MTILSSLIAKTFQVLNYHLVSDVTGVPSSVFLSGAHQIFIRLSLCLESSKGEGQESRAILWRALTEVLRGKGEKEGRG
jgi:hypothetical protein